MWLAPARGSPLPGASPHPHVDPLPSSSTGTCRRQPPWHEKGQAGYVREQTRSPARVARAVDKHAVAARAAASQQNAISRGQLLSLGWTDAMIKSQLAAQRWTRMLRGVYAVRTGDPGICAWWWAAHLYYGTDSALAGSSALQGWGLTQRQAPVEILIPYDRRRSEGSGLVHVQRSRAMPPTRSPRELPPCVTVEHAIIDAIQSCEPERDAAALLTQACQSGVTTALRLHRTIERRSRVRNRKLLIALLVEIEGGALSVLEIDGVRTIFRAHGLPTGRGQVPEHQGHRTVYRDRRIDPYPLIVEFDGRRGHADPAGRLRDHRRDNAAALTGRVTLRFGWEDVQYEACEAARQVWSALASMGWAGTPRRCGPRCRIFDSQRAGI